MNRVLALSFLFYGLVGLGKGLQPYTNIQEAFSAAKQNNKLLLLTFNAIWCPPCNQLKETVYESAGFIEKASDFVLLTVDADAPKSWSLKSRYKVGGYPTVIFADSKGEEIYRIVGARSLREFLRLMELAKLSRAKPLSTACSSKEGDDLWRCALVCRERKDKPCLNKALKGLEKKLKPGSARHLMANTFSVELSETEDLKKLGYEQLMAKHTDSPMALMWAMEYWKLFQGKETEKRNGVILAKVAEIEHQTLTAKDADFFGLHETDILQYRALLFEKLKRNKEAKEAWLAASRGLEARAKSLPSGVTPRSFAMERISCLRHADKHKEALKLTEKYQALYPNEFTFHYIAARLLHRKKAIRQAIPVAEKAYKLSYGDNKIRVATLLIELYGVTQAVPSARRIYAEVKNSMSPDESLSIRTHRYLKGFEKAWSKIQPPIL